MYPIGMLVVGRYRLCIYVCVFAFEMCGGDKWIGAICECIICVVVVGG